MTAADISYVFSEQINKIKDRHARLLLNIPTTQEDEHRLVGEARRNHKRGF